MIKTDSFAHESPRHSNKWTLSHSNHANITIIHPDPTNPRKQQINVEEKALITGNQTSMRRGGGSIASIYPFGNVQSTNDNPFTFSNCQQFKIVHLSKIYGARVPVDLLLSCSFDVCLTMQKIPYPVHPRGEESRHHHRHHHHHYFIPG